MKEQYLQQICNKINERGFTTYDGSDLMNQVEKPFSLDTKEIKQFGWLPEENLKKMAEFDAGYRTAKSFADLYQSFGREGFYKFKPYVVDGKDNETLCIRHNRFLHMFRGYHYQISATPDGKVDCGTGLMRTDNFIKMLHNEDYAKSHLGFIIMYAAMIDCGFQNDNFRSLFYSDKDAVDEYFRKSMEYWGIKFTYGYDIVNKYISYRDGTLTEKECGHYVYCFRDRHGVWCRFWMSEKAVEVEYCCDTDSGIGNSRIIRFDIPDPIEGLDFKSIGWWTDDDTEDMRISFEEACYTHEKVEYFITLMLLKLVGINTNFMASYPIKKIGYIKEDMTAGTISKFDEVMG